MQVSTGHILDTVAGSL